MLKHPELVSGSISQQGKAGIVERWMLKQVQHDGVGVEAFRSKCDPSSRLRVFA